MEHSFFFFFWEKMGRVAWLARANLKRLFKELVSCIFCFCSGWQGSWGGMASTKGARWEACFVAVFRRVLRTWLDTLLGYLV